GNLSFFYLIFVLGLGPPGARQPAIAASLLAFLAYDFFFVPPLHRFTVDDPAEWLSLFALLATALVIGQLTATVQARAHDARLSERRIATLYGLSQLVVSAVNDDTLLAALAQRLLAVFADAGLTACVLFRPDASGTPVAGAHATTGGDVPAPLRLSVAADVAQARWALEHAEAVGGTGGDASSADGVYTYFFVPLVSGRKAVGVLGVAGSEGIRRLVEGLPHHAARGAHLAAPGVARDPQVALFVASCEQVALALDRAVLQQQAVHAEALRESDRLKDTFLGSITHDLRTPLAAIKSAVGTLRDTHMRLDEADRVALLGAIDISAERLNRLVGNLLDLSRIEAGVAAPERDWYLIGDVIAAVLDRLELAGDLGQRPITVDVPATVALVPMDHAQIEQVLTNLIENALKYSPPASRLHIAVAVHDAERELEVTVRDEGVGIPPGEVRAIFEKFHRLRTVELPWLTGRPAAGTGLGLAICAGIIAAHGGRIWAESHPGEGATLRFTLPIPPNGPAGALPDLSADSSAAPTPVEAPS
ncbi:MAG: ATP-binding protein, partial [Ktedonobacterales bacterium]